MPDKDNLIDRTPAATHGAAGTIPPGRGAARVVFLPLTSPSTFTHLVTGPNHSTQIRRVRPDRPSPGQVRQTWTIPVIFGHGSMDTLLVVLVMLNRLTGDRQGQVHLPQGRLDVSKAAKGR